MMKKNIYMKENFLVQFKNIFCASNGKKDEGTLMSTLASLKKDKMIITPLTLLTNSCDSLAPGATLLPLIKAGRMQFIPGKIKHSSAMYKSIRWLSEAAKKGSKIKLYNRISIEIFNVLDNSGIAIMQKRAFIKELRQARLNYRRRKFFSKFFRKRIKRKKRRNIRKIRWYNIKYKVKKIKIKRKIFKKRKKKLYKKIIKKIYLKKNLKKIILQTEKIIFTNLWKRIKRYEEIFSYLKSKK